jgi:dTMP kinase
VARVSTTTWIAFEGGEGCGKSTQAARLADALDAVLTREPGGTLVGRALRDLVLAGEGVDARTETLLMAADRAQHVADVVRPALASGRSVVSDRSAYSSLAYQGVGRGLGVESVRAVCDWATDGLWPDVAVLLDVPPAVSVERRAGEEPDRMESAGDEFHARVAAGFRALADDEPSRWIVVDGTGPVDEVAERVRSSLAAWEKERARG